MQRQDYLERMIAQVATAIARILGLAKAAQPADAEQEIASTWSAMVGLRRADLEGLDAATVRALLGEKRVIAAMLLDAEAELRRSQGRTNVAARLTALASTLRT